MLQDGSACCIPLEPNALFLPTVHRLFHPFFLLHPFLLLTVVQCLPPPIYVVALLRALLTSMWGLLVPTSPSRSCSWHGQPAKHCALQSVPYLHFQGKLSHKSSPSKKPGSLLQYILPCSCVCPWEHKQTPDLTTLLTCLFPHVSGAFPETHGDKHVKIPRCILPLAIHDQTCEHHKHLHECYMCTAHVVPMYLLW